MRECRKLDVDCIVAPYEADAQLAFLNISGIADYVITEDSDLTLFGCKKVGSIFLIPDGTARVLIFLSSFFSADFIQT